MPTTRLPFGQSTTAYKIPVRVIVSHISRSIALQSRLRSVVLSRRSTMRDLTVIVFFGVVLMTTSLLLLALQSSTITSTGHRMVLASMNEETMIMDELYQWSSKQPTLQLTETVPAHRQQEWSNHRYNVVHVITSRFMQHQAQLHHLARARLELLKVITLPSLQRQTNQDFVWILRVDPQLDSDILASLLEATSSMNNIIIHLTNDNPEDFRSISKTKYDTLANPESRTLLESYIDAAQNRTVLETRLDADDALLVSFVEHIQQEAKKQFDLVADKWVVWCVENHLEWQQNSPWEENKDAIVGWKAPHCITPGLTWGFPVGFVRTDESITFQHHKIHKTILKCQNDPLLAAQGRCLHRLESVWPMALRARTITSAGMANLVLDHQSDPLARSLQESHWKGLQDSLWAHVETLFGVSPLELHRVRRELIEHMHDIVVDALNGQCTAGHSCKKHSKEALRQLVAETSAAK